MAPPSPYDPRTSARPLSHTVGELRAFGYAMCGCSQAFRGVAPRGRAGYDDQPGQCATIFRRQGDPMRRRELMLPLGAAMTAASALRAQQKAMPVISFLGSKSPPECSEFGRVPPGAERNPLRR